ncbi:hypothetical protein PM082_018483 [Marasmius tenuissimus]|nr:hypothetical protein PM082_018483 [Marasmius tenuissimus]
MFITPVYGLANAKEPYLDSETVLKPGFENPPVIVFSFCALASNLLLTLLIAGRIIYIAYCVGKCLPPQSVVPTMHKTVLSATLESGLMYPVALVIYIVCMRWTQRHDLSKADRDANVGGFWVYNLIAFTVWDSLITVMGIASTLIIVRVSLGVAIHDEKSFKETIVTEYELTQEQTSSRNVMDVYRQRDSEDMESTRETLAGDAEAQKSK